MGMSLFSSFRWKKKGSPKSTRRVRGRKRIRRGDDLVSPEILLELQIEILTRLPPKSLMRFKCVSKLWFSHIRSRYFSKRHLTVESPPRLYMSLTEHFQCPLMEVCHNPGKSLLVSLTSSSSSNGESFDQDLTMPGMGGHDMVVLRGLILYKVCKKACIYNPTTRQSLTLPPVKSNFAQELDKYVHYFLGHDPVLDQYKVVCNVAIKWEDSELIQSEHWVFVLEAGGFWKRIEFDQPHVPTNIGVCINGVIYYLADTSISHDIIVRFDVRSEEFSMIQAPDDVDAFYVEYGGRLATLDHANLREEGKVELWVLEDGGKWSRKSLVLKPCQMHLVDTGVLKVAGTTRNGEVILAALYHNYILYYDPQKNDLRKVEIRGIRKHGLINLYINVKLINKSESIMHLET